jgi:hypothetical protein
MTICLSLASFLIRNHPYEMGTLPYGGRPATAAVQPRRVSRGASKPMPKKGSLWGDVLRMEGFWSLSLINFFGSFQIPVDSLSKPLVVVGWRC